MGELYLVIGAIIILGFAIVLCRAFGALYNVQPTYDLKFEPNLEILRGCAAFLVFLAHTSMYFGYLAPKYLISTYSGAAGVNIFFMLTAYLFWKQVIEKRIDFNTFFKKRIFRLVPLAVLVITVITLADYVISYRGIPTKLNIINYVKNLSFGFGGVNDIFTTNMYLRINTIWTLKWEWSLYLFLPILAVFPRRIVLLAFLLLFTILFTDINQIFSGSSDFVFLFAFYLGAHAVYIKKRLNDSMYMKRWVANISLFLGVGIAAIYIYHGESYGVQYKSLWCTVSSYFIFIYFLNANLNVQGFISSTLQQLGKVSYSFYLWHLSINYYGIKIVKRLFVKHEDVFFASTFNYVLFGLFFVMISLFISFASYKYIEEFFLKKAKTLN